MLVIFAIRAGKYNFNATEEECKYHVQSIDYILSTMTLFYSLPKYYVK